jgi:ABC-2 type transport system permease protein
MNAVQWRATFGAELTKIRTLPVVWLAVATATVANTVLGIVVATDAFRVGTAGGAEPVERLGTLMLAPVYAFVALPVFAAGSEYRSGQLRVTLAAVPRRGELFSAKLAAAALCTVVCSVVAVLPLYVVKHSPGDMLRWLAVYVVLGLIGFGFAVVTRSAVIPLAVLFAVPVIASPALQREWPGLVRLLPHEAGLSLLGKPTAADTALPATAAACVLGCWLVVFLTLAGIGLTRRDS